MPDLWERMTAVALVPRAARPALRMLHSGNANAADCAGAARSYFSCRRRRRVGAVTKSGAQNGLGRQIDEPMAYLNQSQPVAAGSGFSAFLQNRRASYAKWRLYLRTMRELQSLTDHELADLGIARGNLNAIAHEAVYG